MFYKCLCYFKMRKTRKKNVKSGENKIWGAEKKIYKRIYLYKYMNKKFTNIIYI